MITPPHEEAPKAITNLDPNSSTTITKGQKFWSRHFGKNKEKTNPDPIDTMKDTLVYVLDKNNKSRMRFDRDFSTKRL